MELDCSQLSPTVPMPPDRQLARSHAAQAHFKQRSGKKTRAGGVVGSGSEAATSGTAAARRISKAVSLMRGLGGGARFLSRVQSHCLTQLFQFAHSAKVSWAPVSPEPCGDCAQWSLPVGGVQPWSETSRLMPVEGRKRTENDYGSFLIP